MDNKSISHNCKKRKHILTGAPIHTSKGKIIGQVQGDVFVKDINNGCILDKFNAIASDVCSLHEAERAGAVYVEFTNTDTGVIYSASISKFWDMGKPINYVSPQQMLGLAHFEHRHDPNFTHTEKPEYEDPNGTHESDVKPLHYKSRAAVGTTVTKSNKRTLKQMSLFGGGDVYPQNVNSKYKKSKGQNTMNKITVTNKKDAARLDHNPAAVYLTSLNSEGGRRTMKQALNVCAGLLSSEANAVTFAWHDLRFQHVAAIRSKLTEVYSPASVNKMLAAVRGVLKAAWQLGQMTAEDYFKAASVKSVKGTTLPAGRELTPAEIAALMSACEHDTTNAGARDAAIVALMYLCGPRREEVVTLALADYDAESGRLVVKGKGNKERLAWVVDNAARAMADWLAVRGGDPGALFVSVNKSGRLTNYEHMTPKTIYNMLAKRATEAGVKPFSPHDMRRTFVSDLLDAGADITTVSKMAGHANVTTTSRYDRRPEDAKRKAASLLHVPYAGRA